MNLSNFHYDGQTERSDVRCWKCNAVDVYTTYSPSAKADIYFHKCHNCGYERSEVTETYP